MTIRRIMRRAVVKLLALALAATSASAFVTVAPTKIITNHQLHPNKPILSEDDAQDSTASHLKASSSPWTSFTNMAAAPLIISAATIFLTLTITSHPLPAKASGDLTKGSQIFKSTCTGCHANGQNFIKEKKTLQKEALEKYLGGLEEERIGTFFKKSFVHQNQVGGGRMSEEDVGDVISYVVSQAVGDKW